MIDAKAAIYARREITHFIFIYRRKISNISSKYHNRAMPYEANHYTNRAQYAMKCISEIDKAAVNEMHYQALAKDANHLSPAANVQCFNSGIMRAYQMIDYMALKFGVSDSQ